MARAQAGEEEDSDSFDADIFDSFFSSKTWGRDDSDEEVIEIA